MDCFIALSWWFFYLMIQVPRIDKRVNTLAKLGYRMCVVPKQAEKLLETEGLGKMKVLGCEVLKEVINAVFSRDN